MNPIILSFCHIYVTGLLVVNPQQRELDRLFSGSLQRDWIIRLFYIYCKSEKDDWAEQLQFSPLKILVRV